MSSPDEKDTQIRLVGKVMSRYLDPVTFEPTSDWQVDYNMVVDTGAVEIVKWLCNETPAAAGAIKYMGLGATATAAAHDQTALLAEYADSSTPGSEYARATATLLAVETTAESGNGKKTYRATGNFAASNQTNRDVVAEFGMFTAAASGAGVMLNRSVFSPVKDNKNNALQVVYELTVAPV